MQEEIITILTTARERVALAWYQGAFSDYGPNDTCGVCAMGAINWAATGDPTTYGRNVSAAVALRALEMVVPCDWPVSAYNDHPETTQDEIVELFNKAISFVADEYDRLDMASIALQALASQG